jgi:putative transposase
MRKTYKYQIFGTRATFNKAQIWLILCRTLYNASLTQRISIYRQNKGKVSCYDQVKQLPELKKEFIEYCGVGSQVLADVIERLDRTFTNFYKTKTRYGNTNSGFPRFKSENRYNSFTLKKAGWKLDDKYLIIKKIGRFKLRLSRPIEGDIKTITIKKESTGKWYVCFSCNNVPEKKLSSSDKAVGIDVGIKSFLVDSDGNKVDNPKYFRQSEALLRRRQ